MHGRRHILAAVLVVQLAEHRRMRQLVGDDIGHAPERFAVEGAGASGEDVTEPRKAGGGDADEGFAACSHDGACLTGVDEHTSVQVAPGEEYHHARRVAALPPALAHPHGAVGRAQLADEVVQPALMGRCRIRWRAPEQRR